MSNQPNPAGPNALLRLVEKPDRGRCLVATRLIKPGEVVLVDTPLLLYPSSLASLPLFCSRCFRCLPGQPFPCPTCQVARFCSRRCLSLSHPRLLCHALPSLISGNATWPDDLLFLLSAYSLPGSSLLRLLSLHSNSRFPDESIQILHSQLSSLIPPNLVPLKFSQETTSSLISKEKTNSFSLITPMNTKFDGRGVAGSRAFGLYPWASMINHDCLPNVCRFDYVDELNRENNTDFTFRAFHQIKEGTEICISYVGVTRPYRDRQRSLMKNYGFKCECDRCKIEVKWKESQRKLEDEEEEEEETGEENEEQVVEGEGEELDSDDEDFPHAYFIRYMCDCGGNLAPLPPSDGLVSEMMECNCCGDVGMDTSYHSDPNNKF
ncbi:Histone-lysine N-methyltransferase ASHR2 [Rhynchospora pubera]|uniref:Histone-lysine N-methyltransferase ASHR2 n=1 Tax=Rhynchospora pubera TaxID=906938 RepID=A0AAV8G6N9_9POAL|nr:Histone-lysine N-methyltransferase ASHR2 [Rhynchospora pubera]KAJ4798588.1 Histone-lysine N-methyltransferase ASHR2 [Rhynchospora pubera]